MASAFLVLTLGSPLIAFWTVGGMETPLLLCLCVWITWLALSTQAANESARAVTIVCEESSSYMALVVQLLRFVAVVNGQKKSAMQPTRRLFDPIARSEIHFGHLPFMQDYSLCVEVF